MQKETLILSISCSFLLSVALITASSQALASGENVEVLQTRLAHPWSIAFLPQDQEILITLRGGQLYR